MQALKSLADRHPIVIFVVHQIAHIMENKVLPALKNKQQLGTCDIPMASPKEPSKIPKQGAKRKPWLEHYSQNEQESMTL